MLEQREIGNHQEVQGMNNKIQELNDLITQSEKSVQNKIEVIKKDGSKLVSETLTLENEISNMIFKRNGEIQQVNVELKASDLR